MIAGIFTVLGLVSKLLGFAQFGEAMLKSAQDRRAGMAQQKAADDAASVAAAAKGQQQAGQVAGESAAQVRQDLSGDFRK